MDYTVADTEEVESVVPEEWGGMWFLRDPLECDGLGVTLLELEPGGKGRAHDHGGDRQEEVYLVVGGELTVQLGGSDAEPHDSEVTLGDGEAIRVGPDTRRQLHNHGDERVRVVIAGSA